LDLSTSDIQSIEYKERGVTFGIALKVTKGLGPKPPKAEKPDDIPKIRKLATLKQYGFFYGIPPGFSPTERFFRQRSGSYGGCRSTPPHSDTLKKTRLAPSLWRKRKPRLPYPGGKLYFLTGLKEKPVRLRAPASWLYAIRL